MKGPTFLRPHAKYLTFLFLTWGIYFAYIFLRIIQKKPDGLYAGHTNVWSDWALHISIANTFAFLKPEFWLLNNPLYAGGKFTYPFVTDLISGMLMRAGFSLVASLIIPSIIFSFFLLIGLYFLFYKLLSSKPAALIAVFIFFLSSGLGFVNFLLDFFKDPNLSSILYPIKEYSRFDNFEWYSGNVIVGLLVPQRTFLLGFTLTIWVILGVLYALPKKNMKILMAAGIAAGTLPIIHPHSFIALLIISSFILISYLKQWKSFIFYALPATIISSLIFYIFIWGGIENKTFFSWYPGWTEKTFFSWINMWANLWGLTIPIAILGYLKTIKKYKLVFLSFFIIFILGNLFLFQPIHWDNSKLFFWSYLGFSALCASPIYFLWKKNFIFKIAAILLFLSLTFTGVLEVVRLANINKNTYMISSQDDIDLGIRVREKTSPGSRFLTAPSHNHLIMVWAQRPILLGYTAWAWNYGFNYQKRYDDIRLIYLGGSKTKELLKKYNVSYVVIGPGEKKDLYANENFFELNFPLAFENLNYKIFDVR